MFAFAAFGYIVACPNCGKLFALDSERVDGVERRPVLHSRVRPALPAKGISAETQDSQDETPPRRIEALTENLERLWPHD